MAMITCEKKRFEELLRYMTIGGILPYMGMRVSHDGKIKSIQYDKQSLGAMVVAIGEFDGFEVQDGETNEFDVCIDAKKALDYLKTLKGDETIQIEISDAYIVFRGANKKITIDRLDNIESYVTEAPMTMTDDFLPLFKRGTVKTTMVCAIESNVLSEMVADTKVVDQKQFMMHFEAPNMFNYTARGDAQKRGNDTIEARITDANVEGDTIDITIGIVIPEISNLFKGAIEIHCALVDGEAFPMWVRQVSEHTKIGYLIPPIADVEEE